MFKGGFRQTNFIGSIFYRPQCKRSLNRQFSPKSPEVIIIPVQCIWDDKVPPGRNIATLNCCKVLWGLEVGESYWRDTTQDQI